MKTIIKKTSRKASAIVRKQSGRVMVKSHRSRDVMSESFCHAISEAIQAHERNQIPVAKYDGKLKRVYYLHAEGSKTYEAT